MDKLSILFRIKKIQAYYGLFNWHMLIKKHPEIKNTLVLLLPSCDDVNNYFSLLYINQGIKKMGKDNAVVLTYDNRVVKQAKKFSGKIIKVIRFSKTKANSLMQYACVYNFDDRLVIGSLDEPSIRKGSNLIGLKGVSAEEVFAVGIYKCYPFEKEKPISFENSTFQID